MILFFYHTLFYLDQNILLRINNTNLKWSTSNDIQYSVNSLRSEASIYHYIYLKLINDWRLAKKTGLTVTKKTDIMDNSSWWKMISLAVILFYPAGLKLSLILMRDALYHIILSSLAPIQFRIYKLLLTL